MSVLGSLDRGLVFVISAPAGTGKTTLVRMLTDEFDCVTESVSFTTRKPRVNEREGVDYFFVSDARFQTMIEEGEFLEYAHVFHHYYGTSRHALEKQLGQGKHVILVIDTQGAEQVKKHIDAVHIFIRPPNFDELKQRLHGRQSETKEAIATRLSWAERELEAAGGYDYQVVNEDLKTAYEILRSILIAEEHKNR